MKSISLQNFSDPSHGWLKVKKTLLSKLNIHNKISRYSYIRGDYAYLEEDCDAPILIDTLTAMGINVKITHNYANKSSKIRSYQEYNIKG